MESSTTTSLHGWATQLATQSVRSLRPRSGIHSSTCNHSRARRWSSTGRWPHLSLQKFRARLSLGVATSTIRAHWPGATCHASAAVSEAEEAARRCCSISARWRTGTASPAWARSPSRPTTACWRTRSTRAVPKSGPCGWWSSRRAPRTRASPTRTASSGWAMSGWCTRRRTGVAGRAPRCCMPSVARCGPRCCTRRRTRSGCWRWARPRGAAS